MITIKATLLANGKNSRLPQWGLRIPVGQNILALSQIFLGPIEKRAQLSTYNLYLKVSVQFPKPHPKHQVYLLTICENQPWGNAGCISKEINLKETITFDGKISFFDKFLWNIQSSFNTFHF